MFENKLKKQMITLNYPFRKIDFIILVIIIALTATILFSNTILFIIVVPPFIALLLLAFFQRFGFMPVIPSMSMYRDIPSLYQDIKDLAQIFKNAKKFVYILSGELDVECHN